MKIFELLTDLVVSHPRAVIALVIVLGALIILGVVLLWTQTLPY